MQLRITRTYKNGDDSYKQEQYILSLKLDMTGRESADFKRFPPYGGPLGINMPGLQELERGWSQTYINVREADEMVRNLQQALADAMMYVGRAKEWQGSDVAVFTAEAKG